MVRGCRPNNTTKELDAPVQVLEDVRQYDDVEVTLGNLLEDVSPDELEVRVREALLCESEMARIVIDANNCRIRVGHKIEGQLTLAASDVQYMVARVDALDKEVVVTREAVLDVDAPVVTDRRLVDRAVRAVVGDKEISHAATRIGVGRQYLTARTEKRHARAPSA